MIEPKQLSTNFPLDAAANGVLDVLLQKHLYIYASNSSHKVVRVHKHMVLAQTAEPPKVINAIHAEHRRGSWLKISKKGNQAHPIRQEEATSGISVADDFSAVHYKPKEN